METSEILGMVLVAVGIFLMLTMVVVGWVLINVQGVAKDEVYMLLSPETTLTTWQKMIQRMNYLYVFIPRMKSMPQWSAYDRQKFLRSLLWSIEFRRNLSRFLDHYEIPHSVFRGVSLAEMNLQEIDASDVHFEDCNFDRADISQGVFAGAIFLRSSLEGAIGHKTNFECAGMMNANMRGGNFREARFTMTDLSEADLSDTQLQGAVFSLGTTARRANFTRARLTGAIGLAHLRKQPEIITNLAII